MDQINNKDFLNYIKNSDNSNIKNWIKELRINNKNITVKLYDISEKNFLFNSLFSEYNLYRLILRYLSNYSKTDLDFLEYKYQYKNFKIE